VEAGRSDLFETVKIICSFIAVLINFASFILLLQVAALFL